MSEPAAAPRLRITLSPEAARYARRDAPVEARRMAARGALPLPPLELATVLFVLLHDADAETKETARGSLEGLPPNVRDAVVTGDANPALLSYLARTHRDDGDVLEKIALNAATDDATGAFLATLPHRRIVELMAQNQERILRSPELVEALGANPLTSRSVIDRIIGFLGYHGKGPDTDGASPDEDWGGEISDADAESALRAVLGDDAGFARELVEDGAASDNNANLFALVGRLSVMQKIRLALLGNKEARSLLVRDANKIVATAAIRSPRVREDEVIGVAKSRNVCDEVLRVIADNREWTRAYPVKLALASNPKTPQPKAMHFLNYLQDRDLRQIGRSKDVASAIAVHARRLLDKKGRR